MRVDKDYRSKRGVSKGNQGDVPWRERALTKCCLNLFIEKILINLSRIDITCKSRVLLAAADNKTAARSGDFLAADVSWLPGADSNHGPDG